MIDIDVLYITQLAGSVHTLFVLLVHTPLSSLVEFFPSGGTRDTRETLLRGDGGTCATPVRNRGSLVLPHRFLVFYDCMVRTLPAQCTFS